MLPPPSHLENLPIELLIHINGSLPWDSRLALASTSSNLRSSLAPLIFNSIKITSNTPGGQDLERLVDTYGSLITRLHFVASMSNGRPSDVLAPTSSGNGVPDQDDPSSQESADNATRRFMTDLAHDALTGKLLPKVTTVCLSFDFDFESAEDVWDDPERVTAFPVSIWVFADEETDDDVSMKEAKWPWRTLMAQTWSALCQNSSITELKVLNLIPKRTTTFGSDNWRDFLGCLDTLELRMWGGKSDFMFGNEANTLQGYLGFEAKLGEYFFRHLNQVQRLLLGAYLESPFGAREEGQGEHDIALPLSKEYLPRLRFLELHNIFVSKRLADFVLSKGETLAEVRLHDCHASTYDEMKISWAAFFTRLSKCQLRDLHVTYEQGDASAMIYDKGNRPKKENEEDEVFSYGELYVRGCFLVDAKKMCEKYEERRDLDAYRKLMELVSSNAKDVAQRYL
ncbi:hypothetical protein AAF712_013321 [Marasmius tenuissimus]|uniref:F-box domain-containing protein n=1 Tax=Marasmius tenuissimus TaxID=585030 RepID=A0ABR2ZE94_9AGAR